jgi:hypothetical protein
MTITSAMSPVRRERWLLRTLVALVVIGALGGFAVWGFIEGRGEAALEAERERPVKAPLRVSLDGHGEPFVTLDAETRKQSGVEVAPRGTPYQDEMRAYGTVLDLDKLVVLDNNYVTAIAHIQTAQAKLVASELLAVLRKVEKRGALEIAKRLHQTVGQIFRYGIVTGRANRDPSVDLKGALKAPGRQAHHKAARTSKVSQLEMLNVGER